ncbi:MAG: T9SS type A sorting domain-containing protein [Bacteroidia bacterium]
MKRKLIITLLFIITCSWLFGQPDSTYTYTFNCQDCGTYETVSFEPIDLQTSATVSNLILPDSANISIAQFSSGTLRKPKPKVTNSNRFKIYPNPVKDKFYLYIESSNSCNANYQLIDIYGRILIQKEKTIVEGVNIFKEEINSVAPGIYFVKATFNNNSLTKKIHIKE